MIINLQEQHGGVNTFLPIEEKYQSNKYELKLDSLYEKSYGDVHCYKIKLKDNKIHATTSYFIGVDWIIENSLAIYVQPKLNDEKHEVNYIKMLFEAMQDSENFKHLDGLCYIDFKKEHIKIEQKDDVLSPFLIIQFLQILRQIVKKGLKKSYYDVTQNLNAKVKGKILVNDTIKRNIAQGRLTHTVCKYQEFGLNNNENKLLKKAFLFSQSFIENYKGLDIKSIESTFRYINPAFETVENDLKTNECKSFKPNPMYKEYGTAIELAQLILKRFSYNITNTTDVKISTPPFWIDMSKLFELYVFKKLRDKLKGDNEVIYHKKAHYQEIDFLINRPHNPDNSLNSLPLKMVVDAKYKPYYHDKNILTKDARQVCGYARLEEVYKELGMESQHNINLDCLIIYSHQDCDKELNIEKFKEEKNKIKGYVNIYKVGIRLPQK